MVYSLSSRGLGLDTPYGYLRNSGCSPDVHTAGRAAAAAHAVPYTIGGATMSSSLAFAEYVSDQIRDAGEVSFRKMFGEYAVYCDGKVVALICDDQLFVKQTAAGRAFIGEPVEAPAYEGAKLSFLIGERLDDREWMARLIRITTDELPPPKPKKPKPKPSKS
jgi:TfoX/Sxy family transcriptional regulator of competence genes